MTDDGEVEAIIRSVAIEIGLVPSELSSERSPSSEQSPSSQSSYSRPDEDGNDNTKTSSSSTTTARRRRQLLILSQVCENLRKEFVVRPDDLQYIDASEWQRLGAPIGLVAALRKRLSACSSSSSAACSSSSSVAAAAAATKNNNNNNLFLAGPQLQQQSQQRQRQRQHQVVHNCNGNGDIVDDGIGDDDNDDEHDEDEEEEEEGEGGRRGLSSGKRLFSISEETTGSYNRPHTYNNSSSSSSSNKNNNRKESSTTTPKIAQSLEVKELKELNYETAGDEIEDYEIEDYEIEEPMPVGLVQEAWFYLRHAQVVDWILPFDHRMDWKERVVSSLDVRNTRRYVLNSTELWFIFHALFVGSILALWEIFPDTSDSGSTSLTTLSIVFNFLTALDLFFALAGLCLFSVLNVVTTAIRIDKVKDFLRHAYNAWMTADWFIVLCLYLFFVNLLICLHCRIALIYDTHHNIDDAGRNSSLAWTISATVILLIIFLWTFYQINLLAKLPFYGRMISPPPPSPPAVQPPAATASTSATSAKVTQRDGDDDDNGRYHRNFKDKPEIAVF